MGGRIGPLTTDPLAVSPQGWGEMTQRCDTSLGPRECVAICPPGVPRLNLIYTQITFQGNQWKREEEAGASSRESRLPPATGLTIHFTNICLVTFLPDPSSLRPREESRLAGKRMDREGKDKNSSWLPGISLEDCSRRAGWLELREDFPGHSSI